MRKFHYLFGLAVSAFFVYLFIRNIHLQKLLETLGEADYWYVIPLIFANVFALFLRSVRWKYLLSPVKRIPLLILFPAAFIGFMANVIFPARLGEFARAVIIGKKEKISKSSSFATIVVERLFDGFMVVFLFSLTLLFFPYIEAGHDGFSLEGVKLGGYSFIAFCFILLVILIGIKRSPLFFKNIFNKILSPFPSTVAQKVSQLINSFSEGLAVLRHSKEIWVVVFSSLAIWTIYVLEAYFLFSAFGIRLPFMAAVFLQVLLALGVALPSAPAYIGTFHLACALGLMILGVPSNYARSYSVILWFIDIFPSIMLGVFFLWKEGISLKKIKAENPELL
jgi:glycosyltransferase 2 family protein